MDRVLPGHAQVLQQGGPASRWPKIHLASLRSHYKVAPASKWHKMCLALPRFHYKVSVNIYEALELPDFKGSSL